MPTLLPVVGAAFPNRDGRSRRLEIACCSPGEPVRLAPEPANAADPHAIAVYSARDIQIGYVRARMTARVERHLALGGEAVGVFLRASFSGAEVSIALRYDEQDGAPSWTGLYG